MPPSKSVVSKDSKPTFEYSRMPKMTLLSDSPLRENYFHEECFGLGLRLGPIFDAIRHEGLRTPFSVMVSGGWGTGKTSAMAWLEEQLKQWATVEDRGDAKKVHTCWFHPWKYQTKEDVWRGLLAEVILKRLESEEKDPAKVIAVAAEFGRYFGSAFLRPVLKKLADWGIETYDWENEVVPHPSEDDANKNAIARLKRIFRFTGKAVADAAKITVKVDNKPISIDPLKLSTIAELYQKNFQPHEAYLNTFEKAIKVELEGWLGADKERLCIFIDDLDRCMPDVAVQVLEALKLYLNLPSVIFVVGVDRSVLDKVIIKRHLDLVGEKEWDDDFRVKARAYADKMFQVEVNIEPSESQTDEFFSGLCARDEATKAFWDSLGEHKELFESYLKDAAKKNPRTMVRTMNTMLLSAERLRSEDNTLSQAQALQHILLQVACRQIGKGELIKDQAIDEFFEGASKIICKHGADAVPLRTADFMSKEEAENLEWQTQ